MTKTVAIAEAIWKWSENNFVTGILREYLQDQNSYSKVYGSKALWDVRQDSEATVSSIDGSHPHRRARNPLPIYF